ncbi:pupal cuticle protein C1B [Pectinophora gossypiella]|uniref:pupal cuticle protein C1B n=1 Tax=Pectinophora gossypiella TaxID=13191 RepID=UPI00214E0979|nr:pupal cuticle protein C1B [Pectinophora gossypiella]
MQKLIFLCCFALVRAGVISTNIAPAPTVYHTYNAPLTYTKTLPAPAPVYESVLTTHQTQTSNIDGTQHNTYAKTLNTPYSTVNKYESRATNTGLVAHSVPVYSAAPVISHPQATYNIANPVVHAVSSPITYTHHAPIVTKTISTPVVAKTITPQLSYTSHTPLVQAQPVKITYSEAPLVSHMTFTGLGTSYSW